MAKFTRHDPRNKKARKQKKRSLDRDHPIKATEAERKNRYEVEY